MADPKKNNFVKSDKRPDAKRSKSRLMLILIIAIGAYSKDSLFVRYLIPVKTFSVVRSTSMGGSVNTGIFRAYQTKYGELLAPVQVMLYLNIRNESDYTQTIEGVLLEFREPNGNWLPIKVLSYGSGIYTDFGGSTQLKKAKLLDLEGISLEANLGSGSLAPQHVVSGWLFLEYPEEFRNKNMLKTQLRITIYSGFGERESQEIRDVDLPSDAAQTRSAFLKFKGIERDISGLTILAEGDLMKKLAEKRKAH
jgi:hypothetical protein